MTVPDHGSFFACASGLGSPSRSGPLSATGTGGNGAALLMAGETDLPATPFPKTCLWSPKHMIESTNRPGEAA